MIGRQDGSERFAARQIAVAVLGFLLFTPPLLSLFDRRARVLGIPILVAYLFIAWAVVIGLAAAIHRNRGSSQD